MKSLVINHSQLKSFFQRQQTERKKQPYIDCTLVLMKDTHYNKEHFVHVYLFTMVKYSHIFKKNREIEYDKVFTKRLIGKVSYLLK